MLRAEPKISEASPGACFEDLSSDLKFESLKAAFVSDKLGSYKTMQYYSHAVTA